jgi:branched-subunit amino acid transport protein
VTPILVLALVCLTTWLLRVALVAIVPAVHLPTRVHTALDDVAPAVLAALVVSSLAHGRGPPALEPADVAATLIAGAIAWRTRRLGLTVVAGIAAAALLRLVL